MERAIAIDRQLFERQLDRQNRNTSGSNIPAPVSAGPQPDDMQLDALQIPGRPLSAEERQRRLQNNLCLYCGGAGHRIRNCPAKN